MPRANKVEIESLITKYANFDESTLTEAEREQRLCFERALISRYARRWTSFKSSRSWFITAAVDSIAQGEAMNKLLDKRGYPYFSKMERSADGFLHQHILIENRTAIRRTTLLNLLPNITYCEPRRGSREAAFAYVSKKRTTVPNTMRMSKGFTVPKLRQGERTDLAKLYDIVSSTDLTFEELRLKYPSVGRCQNWVRGLVRDRDEAREREDNRQVTVHYLHGDTCTGKTLLVEDIVADLDQRDVYRVRDYLHPWDQYKGERVVVYDDLCPELISTHNLKISLLPGLNYLQCRGDNKVARFTTVYLVSNRSYSEWKDCATWKDFNGFIRTLTSVEELREGGELVWDEEFVEDAGKLLSVNMDRSRSVVDPITLPKRKLA